VNVLAYCGLVKKLNEGHKLKWKNDQIIKRIGLQKTMVKGSTINWSSAPSYRGGAVCRWGDDWFVLSAEVSSPTNETTSIIYIDLSPEVNDIHVERNLLIFDTNSLNHKYTYSIVEENEENSQFISKHDPPLELGTVSCETIFKITDSSMWEEDATEFVKNVFAAEFKDILKDSTRQNLMP